MISRKQFNGAFLAALMVLSVFAGAIALTGTAAAASAGSITDSKVTNADANLTSGDPYWIGQQLLVDTTANDTVWNVYSVQSDGTVGSLVTQISLDGNGTALLDTGMSVFKDDQDYVIGPSKTNLKSFTNGAVGGTVSTASNGSFSLNKQTLTADPGATTVQKGDTVDISLSSTRVGYDLKISSPNASASELKNIFGGTKKDGSVVLSSVGSTVTADFAKANLGDYTFNLDVTDTTASASVSITVEEATNVAVSTPGSVSVKRGDVFTLPVELTATDTAYVAIGKKSSHFRSAVKVTDGDNDGKVVLKANTYNLINNNLTGADLNKRYWTKNSDDSVMAFHHDGANKSAEPLPVDENGARSYDIRIGSSENGKTGWNWGIAGQTDRTVLRVIERSTNGINVWTAPASEDLSSVSKITDAVSNNTVTKDSTITLGDKAVVEVKANGIFGAYKAQAGNNTEKLIYANQNVSSYRFSLNEPPGTFGGAKSVSLMKNANALTVVPNQDGGSLYVVVDTSSFKGTDGSTLAKGDQLKAKFTVNKSTALAVNSSDVTVEKPFKMEAASISFDKNDVSPETNQTISGTTNLAPGTEIKFSITSNISPDTQTAFLTEFTATVAPDGTWSGQADFSQGVDGLGYDVAVISPSSISDQSYSATIGRPTASLSVDSATTNTVTVSSATLSQGGFLVVKKGSATGSFAGVSSYLSGGEHSNIEIPVSGVSNGDTLYVVAYTDANGNQQKDGDAAYKNADGSPVSGSVTVEAAQTKTETATKTATKTETTTESSGQTTTSPSTTQGPGFTAVLALVALVAAALAAVRRWD